MDHDNRRSVLLYETFYFAHRIHKHTPHHQSARQHDRLAPAYPATRAEPLQVESDREKNHWHDVPDERIHAGHDTLHKIQSERHWCY